MRQARYSLPLLTLLAAVLSSPASASQQDTLTSFRIKNLNPFIQIFGLPATEAAEINTAPRISSEIALDIANNSISSTQGNEDILLDGETYRLNLALHYGIDPHTEVGVELPFVSHSRGILDNFIEGWHDFFGLTNSARNGESNKLHYFYANNGDVKLDMTLPNQGIGDIRLTAAKRLFKHADSTLSLHSGLKLATGDAQQLHGSGGTDFSISLAYMQHRNISPWAMSGFANGGLIYLGGSEILPQIQHKTAFFGSTGLIWDSPYKLDLKAQLDFHSAIYHSDLAQLGNNTMQLTVGGSLHLSPTTRLDIGVGENLLTDTTPDFLINLVLRND